jgi:hypothetical protein
MKYTKSCLGLLFVLGCSFSYSQTEVTVRDFETWSNIGLSKEFDNNLQLNFEQGLRLYDNSSSVGQYFSNLELLGKFNDNFSIAGGLRYLRKIDLDNGNYENFLRFNADAIYKHKLDRFTFKYRLRLQGRNELGISRTEGDFLRNSIRFKAGIRYNIRNWKLDPSFSGEIFREYGKYMLSSFNKYRFTLGTKYKINSFMDVNLYYRFERELGVSIPQSTNIAGLKLTFNL